METEFEVKILDIDVRSIRNRITAIGANFVENLKYRRYVYNPAGITENNGTWARLRTDGKHTTLAVKTITDKTIEGTKEIEVKVEDFEKTNTILKKLLILPKAHQENKRELWKLGDVEICIDEWPKIPAYLEIEGPTKGAVEKVVKLLGFSMEQTTGENTRDIYLSHGIKVEDFKELKF